MLALFSGNSIDIPSIAIFLEFKIISRSELYFSNWMDYVANRFETAIISE